LRRAELYRKLISFSKWRNLDDYNGHHSKLVAHIVKLSVNIYGSTRLIKKSNKFATKINYADSEYVGAVIWGCYGLGERMLRNEFEKKVQVEFEGYKLMAMSCWNSYLSGCYGDYMQLPPEDKRICHSFTAIKVDLNE
jgi:lipopolysaccharide cholinephosphotransferase